MGLATVVQAQVQVTSTTLPFGGINQSYSTQLTATGGVAPYFWSTPVMDTPSGPVTSLPTGFTLASNGLITGSTKTSGVYPFHVDVFDSNQVKGSANLQIIIIDIQTDPLLPGGQTNLPYSQQLSVNAGTPTWSLVSGLLPSGLALSSSGALSGTPTAIGTFTFTLQAAVQNVPPASAAIAQRQFQLTINPGPLGISITSLPDGMVGQPYSQTFRAAGGTPPYIVAATASTIPPGISFTGIQQGNAQSTAFLSGNPTVAGTYALQFQATDSAGGTVNRTIPLTIAPGPNSGPLVQITPANLRFATFEGAGTGATQDLVITSTSGAAIAISAAVAGGPIAAPSWLTVTNVPNSTPAVIRIRTNPGNLAPGTYQTVLRITPANQPSIDVPISFVVAPADPQMQVSPRVLQTSSRVANPRTDLILSLRNIGGGPTVDYSLTLASNSRWITKVTSAPARLSASQPVIIRLSVDISGLRAGAYRDELRITSSIGTLRVPISLFVEEPGPVLSVAVRGVRLAARVGDPPDDKQTILIRNGGTAGTTVNWTASIIRGADVFTLSATQGSATPGSPSPLTIGLKPIAPTIAGGKSALLRITDSRAQGSPEYVVLIADVAPTGGAPQTALAPAGLVFTAVAGATPPPAQTFEFRTSAKSLSFTAAPSTTDGANWLSIGSPSGVSGSGSPATVRVLVASANLAPGVYTGLVTLSAGTQARSVAITLIVLPAGSRTTSTQSESKSAPVERRADGCAPARVAIAQTALAESFSVPAGWPATLTVKLLDDCGTSLPNGDVIASFSNGDAPVVLEGDGLTGDYTTTWQPGASATPAIVTVDASAGTLQAASLEITGGIDLNPTSPPSLVAAGLLNNLNPIVGAPLAPGTVTQVYGDNLTDTPAQPSNVPLPTSYKGVEALIGGLSAPIYYISKNQLTVQVPSELAPNRLHSALLITDSGYSLPVSIPFVPVQPGTVSFNNGALVAQHANFALVTPANPAKPNEIVIIYLVGMGATNPPIPSGEPAPGTVAGSLPATVNTNATITVDNQPAEIFFQGLTPGGVGLYQINFRVPANAKAGSLDIVINQDGNLANATKLAVGAP